MTNSTWILIVQNAVKNCSTAPNAARGFFAENVTASYQGKKSFGIEINNFLDCYRASEYSWKMKTTARTFKALSDETRLRILCLLLNDELCVCDLIAVLQLPQSTVSRHLAYLKNTGWVDDRRCGVWMYYSIVEDGSHFKKSLLKALREHLPRLELTVADRERLSEFSQHNSCA